MKSVFRPFPLPLTGRQKFYLFILQGLSAGIIDAGANFGIAYAMYSKQDQVKMWIFSQNTIAGDLGVTPIIQTLISMIISSTLVHTDLHNSKIRPLAFCYPHVESLPDPRTLFGQTTEQSERTRGVEHKEVEEIAEPVKGISYYYWMLVRFIFEGTEQNMLAAKPGLRAWFGRLLWTALQGAAIGIVFGFPIFCLFILILGPIYKMDNMGGTWAPQIIKGVYGAVLGWVTNPVIAILALGSQAEQSLIVVEVDEEADETIHEGQVFTPPPRLSPKQSLRPLPSIRSRSGSGSSSINARPPFTANTSYFSPDGRARAQSNAQPSLAPVIPARQRGATVSYPQNESATLTRAPLTPRSFSYALGGSGGRAQRSGSVISQIPSMLSPALREAR